MSVERSIFADVLSYQLITSTLLTDEAESLKLNGSREKKSYIVPYGTIANQEVKFKQYYEHISLARFWLD